MTTIINANEVVVPFVETNCSQDKRGRREKKMQYLIRVNHPIVEKKKRKKKENTLAQKKTELGSLRNSFNAIKKIKTKE